MKVVFRGSKHALRCTGHRLPLFVSVAFVAGTRVNGIVVFGIIDVEFIWIDTDDWAWKKC